LAWNLYVSIWNQSAGNCWNTPNPIEPTSVDQISSLLKETQNNCWGYQGQQVGAYQMVSPELAAINGTGRTDVEGCCWWGRGVIQTTGVCNFGKLNYYLGARAQREGRDALYKGIDFCRQPD